MGTRSDVATGRGLSGGGGGTAPLLEVEVGRALQLAPKEIGTLLLPLRALVVELALEIEQVQAQSVHWRPPRGVRRDGVPALACLRGPSYPSRPATVIAKV